MDNTEEYIQEAIDSIIQQINYVLEIILIDDGSDDGSSELVNNLYLKNSKYWNRIIKQNEGQGVARNIGEPICARAPSLISLILMIFVLPN